MSSATAVKTKKSPTRRKAAVKPKPERVTWEIARLFPEQGLWTEADYWGLDASHQGFPLVELSDGHVEVLPMPTQTHQLLIDFIVDALKAHARIHAPGVVLFSGMRVRLREGRYREPDIVYMKAEHAARRDEKYWDGADLVIEIVSSAPKDRVRDYETKRREYAQAGIPEYWIVDPEKHLVRVLILRGKAYRLHGEFGRGVKATSVVLNGFAVSVSELFSSAKR